MDDLEKLIDNCGFAYDEEQDIFYSKMDAWQRDLGYCSLYDDSSVLLGMIFDREPIYFDYKGKKWLIELWKGQYDYVTGAEVGIYTGALDVRIPGKFIGTFYKSVSDDEMLQMSYTLKKNGQILLTREGRHWWLTGFKLFEYSEPEELTLDVSITFDDTLMLYAFVAGLKNTGYSNFEIEENKVNFTFDKPFTPKPAINKDFLVNVTQKKNQLVCISLKALTDSFVTTFDKIRAIRKLSPIMFEVIMNIGGTRQLYDLYKLIRKYAN